MASAFPAGCTTAATTSPECRLLHHRTAVSWDRRLKRRADPSAYPANKASSEEAKAAQVHGEGDWNSTSGSGCCCWGDDVPPPTCADVMAGASDRVV